MAISLEAFQRAATIGGRITLDKRQDDGLNASNGQMGGKSVAWVKDTWPSSAVKEENRAAIQSFVEEEVLQRLILFARQLPIDELGQVHIRIRRAVGDRQLGFACRVGL